MKQNIITTFIIIGLLLIATHSTKAQEAKPEDNKYKIIVAELYGEVGTRTVNIVQGSIEKAEDIGASLIIFKVNTYGGILDHADKARQKILNSQIPTWAFINKNAASAGALLSIACDSIYMTGGASIGAATVVNYDGEPATDKYQSYMRSIMRSTASENGRNPRIAEAMVDERIEIDSIKPAGRILTFSTQEALQNGYCNGKFENIEDILKHYQASDYELVPYEYKPISSQGVASFLRSNLMSGILIFVMILGLYIELSTPGFGIPILVSAIAALLFVSINYIEGFVENWELIALVIGLALLAAEFLVIPGFGIAGILGIIFVTGSLGLMMLDNDGFDLSKVPNQRLYTVMGITTTSLLISVIGFFVVVPRLMKTKAFKKISIEQTMDSQDGYVSHGQVDYDQYIGMTGEATSILRPSGKIIIDGKIYDAKAKHGYIEIGSMVKVLAHDGPLMIVLEDQ